MNGPSKTVLRLLGLLVAGQFIQAANAATLLVLNKDDSTLSLHDPVTGASLATIPTGTGPHEVEVTADGRMAVVSNYGAGSPGTSLSVVDLGARKEARRVEVGQVSRPHGLASAGQQVYFTAENARGIGRIDIASGKVDWRFATNQERTHMVLASRDGRTIFTTNMGSNSVSIIDRAVGSDAKQTLVGVGKGPEGMDLTPDGRQLWSANAEDGTVSIVDIAQRKLVKTFDIGTRRSNRLKFTPDGALALVSDLVAGELIVIDVRDQSVRKRIAVGRGPTGVLVVPDGSRAYVAASTDNKLAIIDLKTLAVVGSVPTGTNPDGMAWVP
jgi:YVTN family beta-propeller protein